MMENMVERVTEAREAGETIYIKISVWYNVELVV